MPKCNRCGESIDTIPELKTKIKTCDRKKCKCKTQAFQKDCAHAFECSAEDFISVTEINLVFYPVKLPENYSGYRAPTTHVPRWPVHGGSWLCINDPMKDCTCGTMVEQCQHFLYGYD